MTVLTAAAGLFCILVFLIHRFGKGLLIRNLRCADVSLYLVFTEQTVNDNLQMEFAHTCDNGLSCLGIRVCAECSIFLRQFCKRLTHFALTRLCLGLDSQFDNGLGEFHGLQNNRMLVITNSITGCGQFKPDCRSNITGVNLIQFCSLVCVHLQDTTDSFSLIFGRVKNVSTRSQSTGIYTEECQLPYIWVCHDFESQSAEWFAVACMAFCFFTIFQCSFNCRNICWGWAVVHNSIQQHLYTFVFEGGTAEYWNHFHFTSCFANSTFDFFNG